MTGLFNHKNIEDPKKLNVNYMKQICVPMLSSESTSDVINENVKPSMCWESGYFSIKKLTELVKHLPEDGADWT